MKLESIGDSMVTLFSNIIDHIPKCEKDDIIVPKFSKEIISNNFSAFELRDLLINDENLYQNTIFCLNRSRDWALEQIKSFKYKVLNNLNTKEEKDKYLYEVNLIYQSICFFNEPEADIFFNKVGLDEQALVWYKDISLNMVEIQFQKIYDNARIVLFKGRTLFNLIFYTLSRITNDIDYLAGNYKLKYSGVNMASEIRIDFKNLIRRMEPINFEEPIGKELLKELESKMSEKELKKSIEKYLGGKNIKETIVPFVELSKAATKTMNENSFYAEFFDLLKPFIEKKSGKSEFKNKFEIGYKLLSEKEYKDEFGSKNKQFITYKGKRIKEIITRC